MIILYEAAIKIISFLVQPKTDLTLLVNKSTQMNWKNPQATVVKDDQTKLAR